MSHDNTAHEDLDGSDALERHLALARCLVEAEFVSELVFGNSVGVWIVFIVSACADDIDILVGQVGKQLTVNLVAKDEEGSLGEILH